MKGRGRWRAYVMSARRRRQRAWPPDDARRGEGRAAAPSDSSSSSWRSWLLNPSAASRQCGAEREEVAMGGRRAALRSGGEGRQCLLAGDGMGGWMDWEGEKRADSTREASKHTIKFAHYTDD
jgi:hypothetical protein